MVERIIVASRGRNPSNPSDRTTGAPTEQRLEPNSEGLCNTLTSVQKDNYVLEIRTVDDLAARLYVSREHLSRCFSAELGVPVSRYMMTTRVSFSALCLRQGAGLDEVCAKCGWNDYSYFIKVFRREIGMTPAKYREKYSVKR